MQTQEEVGKYVTDGKMTYPYNAYLDDLLANGTLQFCEKPSTVKASPKLTFRSPLTYTPEERLVLAQKMGVKLGDLTNMSPQEFEDAMVKLDRGESVAPEGFPA